MASIPVCPLLSIRNHEANELCVQDECALYIPAAKKCSLLYIGFKAMADLQKMQPAPPPKQG